MSQRFVGSSVVSVICRKHYLRIELIYKKSTGPSSLDYSAARWTSHIECQ